MLWEERERLRETDPFTILDYIKTSIEILMNMKMEEHEAEMQKNKRIIKKKKDPAQESEKQSLLGVVDNDDLESSSECGKNDRINDYD